MTVTSEPQQGTSDVLARRNAFILATAQAFSGAAPPIVIAMSGLAGYYLLDTDKSLATLPVSAYLVGTAAGAVPAALLMQRIGRRLGFMSGSVLGVVGSLMSAWAIFQHSFILFCLASAIAGMAGAFVQQYRFAAADTASDDFRPKAISWVMAGGMFAAVIGPQTVIFTKDYFLPIPFAGAYVGAAVLQAIGMIFVGLVNIPRQTVVERKSSGRPLGEILIQPRFLIAITCAISAFSLMVLVMTAAPLAMIACNHSESEATLGIQWHVLAMFAPSFFTGSLIARFGKEAIVATGMLFLASCAAVSLAGIDLANFWAALVLLGVGWNFGFIGATAMVTDCYRTDERAKVQAANDFLVFGFVGASSLLSGALLNAFGWATINILVFPIVGLCLTLLLVSYSGRSRETA